MQAAKRPYEKPAWARLWKVIRSTDISYSLPTAAMSRGWELREVEFEPSDPVFLYDAHGRILREWDYVPSLTEVFEACQQLAPDRW